MDHRTQRTNEGTDGRLEVVESLMTILADGQFVATYKFAVLIGLLDLVAEWNPTWADEPPVFTTRQLAEKVLNLYWPQTVGHTEHVLIQGRSGGDDRKGGTAITRLIIDFRARLGLRSRLISLDESRRADADWRKLIEDIEWVLVEMPLPRLQLVGGVLRETLYTINFEKKPNAPKLSEVRRASRGETSTFDNRIQLLPGVAPTLLRLAPMIRSLVESRWVEHVSRLNGLPDSRLHGLLFGTDRIALQGVRPELVEIQSGRCFYCRKRLDKEIDVDHFVPWSRTGDNAVQNLVVAHAKCNRSKSDTLAGVRHVERWARRNDERAAGLRDIARMKGWIEDSVRTHLLARGAYATVRLGEALWLSMKTAEIFDDEVKSRLADALSAFR